MTTKFFAREFSAASALDTGKKRASNQDRVIFCPDTGFFAVSDGMGGLRHGGDTAEIIAGVVPGAVRDIAGELPEEPGGAEQRSDAKKTGKLLRERIRLISDQIYARSNSGGSTDFGATLSCVWLFGAGALFVNLGDSRAFLLSPGSGLRQITEDHNIAALLAAAGELPAAEAKHHPSASMLTHFVGMPAPAEPDFFMEPLAAGDHILLCSDGLYGMLDDAEIAGIMRSGGESGAVCRSLVDAANEAGGRDNISVVHIVIGEDVVK